MRRRGNVVILGLCLWLVSPAGVAWAFTQVYVDAAGACDGLTPCFTTIQDGVNHAGPGPDESTVFVFPGMYPESIDLSLMGSAIASTPASLAIINFALTQVVGPATAPATTAAGAAASPGGLPSKLQDLIERARAAALATLPAPLPGAPPTNPGAGMGVADVLVNPAAGPAIFHSAPAFPGNMMRATLSLAGLTVKSVTDGIRLPKINGEVSLSFITADDNGGRGLTVGVATVMMPFPPDEDLSATAIHAHGNAGAGIVATADGRIDLFAVSADGNGAQGIKLTAGDEIRLVAVPTDFLPGLTLPPTTANDNAATGIDIDSKNGAFLGPLVEGPTGTFLAVLEANRNGGLGVDIENVSETVALFGVMANRNREGVRILTQEDVFVVASDASDNTVDDGFDVTSTAMGSMGDPFPGIEAFFAIVSANRNATAGFSITLPNAAVLVAGSTAIMNADGVRLVDLGPGALSQVTGNILCSNTASGLRLLDNVTVDAEGNWWGDVTGPFHAVKNPGGLGNPVVDGSSGGGAGDVDFIPFIDTITPGQSPSTTVNQNVFVEFQFSGGNGTVFLGAPPEFSSLIDLLGFLAFETPLALTTNNGQLVDEDETGTTVHSFVNRPNGVMRVRLQGATPGIATITLDGPCNLDSSATIRLNPFVAPLLSPAVLVALAVGLAVLGIASRRHGRRRPLGDA